MTGRVCFNVSDKQKDDRGVTILWLVDSLNAHPDLARGEPPDGLLSAAEAARLARYHVGKRRCDWLLGRWTAKRLLAPVLGELPTVLNAPDGAPYVPGAQALSLSISHSGSHACCAAAWGAAVGVDLEKLVPRSRALVDDFFTDAEAALVDSADPGSADLLITLIWSAKEAALKALRTGLTVSTRSVEVCPAAPRAGDCWHGLTLRCCAAGDLNGWWRVLDLADGSYVLTLAADGAQADNCRNNTSEREHSLEPGA